MVWDILIASISHRTDMLAALLAELGRQIVPGVGVICYRDNRKAGYTEKCRRLYEASEAEYVSMVDDDDWVSEDFVSSVMEALEQRPDQVGYRIRYTEHGVPQQPVVHRLSCGGWFEQGGVLYRDLCHKNPVRRELAPPALWDTNYDGGSDVLWAFDLRDSGVVKSEVFIDRELYHYRSTGSYNTSALQPLDDPPPRPDFPWVRWID